MVPDIPDTSDRLLFDLSSPHIISILRDLLNRGVSVRIRVTGASMRPFLLGGESVTIHNVEAKTLGIGDIILFVDKSDRPIMHRIVRRRYRAEILEIQTKGDSIVTLDAPIHPHQILGQVVSIAIPQSKKNKDPVSCIDLIHLGRRVQAIFIARWGMYRYYLYRVRLLLKTLALRGVLLRPF